MAYTGQTTYASIPITKSASSKGVTYVWGRASDGRVDRDYQIVDEGWALAAIKEFGERQGPVRLGHNPQRPVGKAVDTDGLYVKSMIVDKSARKMLRLGVLRAYSVGISEPVIRADPMAPGGRICGGKLLELSVVDEPSNPGCGIQLVAKGTDGTPRFIGKAFGTPAITKKKHKKKKAGRAVYCLKCGTESDAGEKYCTSCGTRNPNYMPMADRKIPANEAAEKGSSAMSKKRRKAYRRLEKTMQRDMLSKAAGARFPVYSTEHALRVMLLRDVRSCDPGRREAAREALRGLG